MRPRFRKLISVCLSMALLFGCSTKKHPEEVVISDSPQLGAGSKSDSPQLGAGQNQDARQAAFLQLAQATKEAFAGYQKAAVGDPGGAAADSDQLGQLAKLVEDADPDHLADLLQSEDVDTLESNLKNSESDDRTDPQAPASKSGTHANLGIAIGASLFALAIPTFIWAAFSEQAKVKTLKYEGHPVRIGTVGGKRFLYCSYAKDFIGTAKIRSSFVVDFVDGKLVKLKVTGEEGPRDVHWDPRTGPVHENASSMGVLTRVVQGDFKVARFGSERRVAVSGNRQYIFSRDGAQELLVFKDGSLRPVTIIEPEAASGNRNPNTVHIYPDGHFPFQRRFHEGNLLVEVNENTLTATRKKVKIGETYLDIRVMDNGLYVDDGITDFDARAVLIQEGVAYDLPDVSKLKERTPGSTSNPRYIWGADGSVQVVDGSETYKVARNQDGDFKLTKVEKPLAVQPAAPEVVRLKGRKPVSPAQFGPADYHKGPIGDAAVEITLTKTERVLRGLAFASPFLIAAATAFAASQLSLTDGTSPTVMLFQKLVKISEERRSLVQQFYGELK